MVHTIIIAHRGLTSIYPENTLIAFNKAQEMGADKIEFDLHETSDGELVVHHDYGYGNPDNGEGYVSQKTAEYAKSLLVTRGDYSERIPFLEEIFNKLGNDIAYEIELKGQAKQFVQKVVDVVMKHNLVEKVEFTSPHLYVLTAVKNFNKDVKTGMFVPSFPSWMNSDLGVRLMIGHAKLGAIDVLHCPISMLSSEIVTQLHEEGLKVQAADCDVEADIRRAIEVGVDQFSTNYLERALAIREKLST